MPSTFYSWLTVALVVAVAGCAPSPAGAHGDAGAIPATSDGGDTLASCPVPSVGCGLVCVDTNTDSSNCGSCGYACESGQSCCGGSCSTSCALSIASVSVDHGPLSGGTWVTIKGAGFVSGARVFFGGSRAPAMVVDPGTISAQTSPSVAGSVDVRVEQGAEKATRGRAFRYASYGFVGPWQKIKMSSARGAYPGVSVLMDGRVLITGGQAGSGYDTRLATAELYDPATNQTAPTMGTMMGARSWTAQVTLLTGKVLILGTWDEAVSSGYGTVTPAAELFDPQTSTFRPTAGQPTAPQDGAHMTLLPDGKVLVTSSSASGIQIYDPTKDAFASASAPNSPQYVPARLLDGRVLLVPTWGAFGGASNGSMYIYDPDAGTFADVGRGPTGAGMYWGINESLSTLPDGRLLVAAGLTGARAVGLFDPSQSVAGFQPAAYGLKETLFQTSQVLMGDGMVLVLGGSTTAQASCATPGWVWTNAVERIDPVASSVTLFDNLPEATGFMGTATLLDGSVIAVGGDECGGLPTRPYLYFLKGEPPIG